jgi:hypothetical protein
MPSSSYGAVAISSFRAQHPGELSFSAGAGMLIVSPEPTDGWLTAIVGAEQGLVPYSYVRRQELQPAFMSHNFEGGGATELPAFQGERLGLVQTGVQLKGWSLVVRTADGEGPDRAPGPGLVPSSWLVLAPAVQALDACRAERAGELSVEKGEVLWALGKAEGGCLQLLNLRGHIGRVRETLVDLIPDLGPDPAEEPACVLTDVAPERSADGRLTLLHGPGTVRAPASTPRAGSEAAAPPANHSPTTPTADRRTATPSARRRSSTASTSSSDWASAAAGTTRSLDSSSTLVLGELSGMPIERQPRRRQKGKQHEFKTAGDEFVKDAAGHGSLRYACPEEGVRVGSRSRGWAVRKLVRLLPLHRHSSRVHAW